MKKKRDREITNQTSINSIEVGEGGMDHIPLNVLSLLIDHVAPMKLLSNIHLLLLHPNYLLNVVLSSGCAAVFTLIFDILKSKGGYLNSAKGIP